MRDMEAVVHTLDRASWGGGLGGSHAVELQRAISLLREALALDLQRDETERCLRVELRGLEVSYRVLLFSFLFLPFSFGMAFSFSFLSVFCFP